MLSNGGEGAKNAKVYIHTYIHSSLCHKSAHAYENIRLKDNLKHYWYACINTTVKWQTSKLNQLLNSFAPWLVGWDLTALSVHLVPHKKYTLLLTGWYQWKSFWKYYAFVIQRSESQKRRQKSTQAKYTREDNTINTNNAKLSFLRPSVRETRWVYSTKLFSMLTGFIH